ncbi:MAG: Xanthine dehydrogenase family protein, partial [Deltaproteobacteria bacterium]|nr:Xanthine dehydrogenase family protein [Deltaproteobacteria bacterium]
LVAACSWKAKRSVKLQLTVEEAMLTTRSDDAYTWMRTAADANGKIIARQAKIFMNTGAYAENSPLVVEKSTNRCVGPYAIANVLIENCSLYTNTVPASSYRGFGCAQVTLPGESQIDELAAKIGKDPYEFRLANAAKPGEEFFPGMRPFDGTLKQDLDTAAKAIGWGTPLAKGHGRTVAVSGSDAGAYPLTSTAVRVHADGSATIMTGSTELGQGSHTVLPQIAAEELGIAYDKVNVVASDTAITPYDRSTGASRTTTLMGSAVMEACQEAIQQMVVMAADVLKVKVEEIQTVRGGVRCGEVQLDWSQVISKFYALPDGEVIGRSYIRKSGKFAALPVFWEAAATGVEISVDEETGKITMEKLATVGDVGLAVRRINLPRLAVDERLDSRLPLAAFLRLAERSLVAPGAKPRRRRPLRRQRRRRSVFEFDGREYRQRCRSRRRRAHPPSPAHAGKSLARAEREKIERVEDRKLRMEDGNLRLSTPGMSEQSKI